MLYPARVLRRIPPALVVACSLPAFAAGTPPLRAQEATGTIEVAFADPALAPSVRVRLEAAALERQESAVHGRVVFLHLAPGLYEVDLGGACASRRIVVKPGERRLVHCDSRETDRGKGGPEDSRPRSGRFDATTDFEPASLLRAPRPADPWSVLRDAPGVVVDRVNVGGSDSEQQSLLVSHGDPGTGATWSLDGALITDPAAVGTTLLYPDMEALSGLVARTGAQDVRVRTPGVQIDLALRTPETRLAGAAHLRGSSEGLQSENLPAELEGRPFFRNRTEGVSEMGAELGGPLHAGRAWLWGAVFRNALSQATFTEHDERLRTNGMTVKARVRLGAGTLSLLALRGEKVHEDRDTGLGTTHEARWRQSGSTWTFAAEDTRQLLGLSLLLHLSWADGGFALEPYGGHEPSAFEDYRGVLQRSYYSFATQRRRLSAGAEAAAERELFGARHSLFGGVSFWRAPVETEQAWPGNGVFGLERQGVFFRTFRLTGFAIPYRASKARAVTSGLSAYLSDEVLFSRFTASLGLRLERLAGDNRPSSVDANPAFPDLLPAVSYDGSGQGVRWLDLLPRAGLAMAVGERTTTRVGYAAYAAPLGTAEATFDNPLRDFASLTYYWKDANGDAVVEPGELDLVRGRVAASGLDPANPALASSPNQIDEQLRAPRTHEVFAAAERRLGGTGEVTLRVSWRRQTDALWRPLRNLTLADYVARGAVSGSLFGESYSVTYFAPATESEIVPGNGRILTNRRGYAQDTFVAEAQARGRVTNAVDWRAWAAYTDWRERFFDRETALQDPTPIETEPLVDGGLPVVRPGGLGRGDLFVGARFAGGASVRSRLPLGFEASALLHLREGFPVPYFQVASTGDPTAASKNVLVTPRLDRYRLPGLVLVDLRLERGIALGRGRLAAGLDLFNVTNAATRLQVARDVELPAFDRPREIVRPRLLRLGLDYRF